MDVSARLRELMVQQGLSLYMLAKKSDLSWNTVDNICKHDGNPTITTLQMLCNGLGISLVQFFDEEGQRSSVSVEQQHLLNRWEELTDRDRRIINSLMEAMLSNK